MIAKQQLGKANELQEQLRRNGKEVDRERVAALVEVAKERRGVALMEDQAEVFKRCEALNEGERLRGQSQNYEERSNKLLFAACSCSPHYPTNIILTRSRQSSCNSLRLSQEL